MSSRNMEQKIITSHKNERIKFLHKLKQKKHRDETGLYLIEGGKIIQEAFDSGEEIIDLVYEEAMQRAADKIEAQNKLCVTKDIIDSLSALKSPQMLVASVKIKEKPLTLSGSRWMLLDRVSDPANAAAIVRSADCAGFDGVVFAGGSVDIYNEKFLRAAMGSNYHMPVANVVSLTDTIARFKEAGFVAVGSALDGQAPMDLSDKKVLLIVGNESAGMSEEARGSCEHIIKIPIYGKAESMNVACAATVLMYLTREFF